MRSGGLGAFLLGLVQRFRLEAPALLLSRILVEHGLLGRVPIARKLFRRLGRIRLIAPHLDADYYLRQLPETWRVAARRDPVLHYALIGAFRNFSPAPGFDPIFYRADNHDLRWGRDPLAHYARRLLASRDGASAPIATSSLARHQPGRSGPPGPRGHVVTIQHARGGGSERYLGLYEASLLRDGYAVTRLARDTVRAPLFRPVPLGGPDTPRPIFHILEDEAAFRAWLGASGATRIVLNHIVDLPFEFLAWLPEVSRDLAIPFDVMVHDYLALCPRINLVDRTGRFCGGPDVADCDACVSDRRGLATEIRPASWRLAAGDLLRRADRVIAPHDDAARRLLSYWPDLASTVWEPEDDATLRPPEPTRFSADRPLRIGIIGALNVPKGYDVVRRLAAHSSEHRLPLRFILIGPSQDDAGLKAAGVEVGGRYREADAADAIRLHRPDIVFVPAIWPETWSFILTLALRQRLPVYAFDIGAVAARLRRLGWGTLLPLSRAEDPSWLADVFVEATRRSTTRAA